MNIKTASIILLMSALVCSSVYAAKYSVNTSGTVKTNGKVVSPTVVKTTVPNYNVYNASQYVATNQVNAMTGVNNIELVMDYSGSMYNWIGEAKNAMAAIIAQIPSTTNVGFRVFGHDYNGINPSKTGIVGIVNKIVKKNGKYVVQTTKSPVGNICGACTATKQVTSLMPANANALIAGMNSVNIGGSTPMVYGLDRAINEDFAGLDRVTAKKVVLITDGGENCGGNPCEYARQLVKTRRDVHVDVVLVSHTSDASLQCLASVTGGNVYRINNLSELLPTLTQSMNTQPQEIPQQYYEYYEE